MDLLLESFSFILEQYLCIFPYFKNACVSFLNSQVHDEKYFYDWINHIVYGWIGHLDFVNWIKRRGTTPNLLHKGERSQNIQF